MSSNNIKQKLREKKIKRFIYFIPKLTPIEFIGLCNLFKVKILKEDASPRDFSEMLEDCINVFENLRDKQKNEILSLFKSIEKEKKREKKEVDCNGITTKSTKKE